MFSLTKLSDDVEEAAGLLLQVQTLEIYTVSFKHGLLVTSHLYEASLSLNMPLKVQTNISSNMMLNFLIIKKDLCLCTFLYIGISINFNMTSIQLFSHMEFINIKTCSIDSIFALSSTPAKNHAKRDTWLESLLIIFYTLTCLSKQNKSCSFSWNPCS